jgi:hypothetical protein
MSSTKAADATIASRGAVASHDTRGFWRLLLAVVAPLPVLAKGIWYLLIPVEGDADFPTTVAAFREHPTLVGNLRWFDAVFIVLLLPATFAVAWVARRGAPRLATAGASLALLGCLAGFGLLGGIDTPELLTAVYKADPNAMSAVYDAVRLDPVGLIAGLFFIVGIVFGLGLLGVALWRSRAVPAWVGIALMIGGITHPFLPGHVAQGVGLFLAEVGFVGAAVALLRQSNNEFDLPPAAAVTAL